MSCEGGRRTIGWNEPTTSASVVALLKNVNSNHLLASFSSLVETGSASDLAPLLPVARRSPRPPRQSVAMDYAGKANDLMDKARKKLAVRSRPARPAIHASRPCRVPRE